MKIFGGEGFLFHYLDVWYTLQKQKETKQMDSMQSISPWNVAVQVGTLVSTKTL